MNKWIIGLVPNDSLNPATTVIEILALDELSFKLICLFICGLFKRDPL